MNCSEKINYLARDLAKQELSQSILRELFCYDEVTGILTWKVRIAVKQKVGQQAGTKCKRGYTRVMLNQKMYLVHRLIWMYQTGKFPTKEIDHIDGNPDNNAWSNLREASSAENSYNLGITSRNTSGVKGVHWDSRKQKWMGRVTISGKSHFVGYFTDITEAEMQVKQLREHTHKEYARHA